jgi:two-component system, sensor histidine kinase and response regulator
MDCQMPVMDGYETAREIRRRENGGRRIPIIAVTAHAMAGAADECYQAGMDAYQSKPLDKTLLQQCLRKCIDACADADESEHDSGRILTPREVVTMQSAASETESIDWTTIDETCDGDTEFAVELAATFAVSSEQSLTQIRDALASGDLPAAQRAAHSLKGASGSIGATLARALAADLEYAAKEGNASSSALLFEALRQEIERANQVLNHRLKAA